MNSKEKKAKTVCITSKLPAAAGKVFDLLQRVDTLRYISAPYASFKSLDTMQELVWGKGKVFKFRLRIFVVLPMGIHTIEVCEFDKESLAVYTHEHNKSVLTWNHKIIIEPISDNECAYTDEVEIHAGWKTGIVYFWSKCFYRHRQKKWYRLLKKLRVNSDE